MRILVVFGSQSDHPVFEPFVQSLRDDFDVDFHVVSAHRDPDKLHQLVTAWRGDAMVAGAGLAAALPGVVASLTPMPVFGIPVAAHYGGLDALASIAQMPFGVPVITAGPQRESEIAHFLRAWKLQRPSLTEARRLTFVVDKASEGLDHVAEELARAEAFAADKGFSTQRSDKAQADAFNLIAVLEDKDISKEGLCLHAPVLSKERRTAPSAYLDVYAKTRIGGLWLGTNNLRNATLAAARLLGA